MSSKWVHAESGHTRVIGAMSALTAFGVGVRLAVLVERLCLNADDSIVLLQPLPDEVIARVVILYDLVGVDDGYRKQNVLNVESVVNGRGGVD